MVTNKNSKKVNKFEGWLKVVGPGVITGAADDDPSGIATYSQTGAQYGFGLLWTAVFMLPMMYVVQEMSGRIGIVTGKGLAQNIKQHYSKYILVILVGLLLIANTINLGTDIGAMAASAQLLIPVNFTFLAIAFTVVILLLEILTTYKEYAKILKWLTLSLFAYILTGFFIQVNWLQVLKYSITPNIQFNFAFLFLVVGVLGTTISPYMMFWQTNEEIEEEVSHHLLAKKGGIPRIGFRYIGKMKLDTFLGMVFSEIATWFIFVTTAGTLHAHGITSIQTAQQAASALAPLVHSFPYAGEISKILFALGIIGTGLLTIPIFAAASSYAICEIFNWKASLDYKFKKAKAFYIVILLGTIIGLCINLLGINPIQALVYTAVINGVIAVPLIGMLLLISNNKKIMGEFTTHWINNIVGIVTFLVMGLAAFGILATFLPFPFLH